MRVVDSPASTSQVLEFQALPVSECLGQNPWLCAWQTSTLPTELLPQLLEGVESDLIIIRIRVTEKGGLGQNLWLPVVRLWLPVF